MAKAAIIYGSTTGNTERLSEAVAHGLRDGGMEVTVINATDANTGKLADFNLIVLGCSTWGTGELQDDFVDFYNGMTTELFEGKKTAVFGSGDSNMFPDCFCEAVITIESRLKECNAGVITESLKVDGDVEAALEDTKSWGLGIAKVFFS